MKYGELVVIRKALVTLGQERLPIAFEVAKNLRLVDKVIAESEELAKDILLKFIDKDEKGEIKKYPKEDGKEVSKITDPEKLKQYQTEIKKLDDEEHDVPFVKIPSAKLTELRAYEPVIDLYDTIITD